MTFCARPHGDPCTEMEPEIVGFNGSKLTNRQCRNNLRLINLISGFCDSRTREPD